MRATLFLSLLLLTVSSQLLAEDKPPCGLTGSNSVQAEGASMLRLGDVIGCDGVVYEVIPGLMIEGQPAVRLTPAAKDGCGISGAASVMVDGETAKRSGDLNCPP